MEFNARTAQTVEPSINQPKKNSNGAILGSLKNWADIRISDRISGEPGGFQNI